MLVRAQARGLEPAVLALTPDERGQLSDILASTVAMLVRAPLGRHPRTQVAGLWAIA